MAYTVGVIGTGASPDDPDADGFAMAYRHAFGYRARDDCQLVACADIVPENARAFAHHFDVDAVYEDYERLLRESDVDIVSVCVPPGVHADIVCDCAETEVPDAIHCEKPMATTWEDCQRMVRTCDEKDVQLSFNHQKRFSGPIQETKRLIEDGAIGNVTRLEFSEAHLYDTGTHLFDICTYLTDRMDVEWVMGQVDYREENVWFGAHNENHGLATWKYADGTTGLAVTGEGADFVGCYLRVRGTDGCIEVEPDDGPTLRVNRDGNWRRVDTDSEGIHSVSQGKVGWIRDRIRDTVPGLPTPSDQRDEYTERAIAEVVEALEEGLPPSIGGRTALQSTELIFAAWESSRRRARIDLPLEIDDNPLEAMVKAGDLQPTPTDQAENPASMD